MTAFAGIAFALVAVLLGVFLEGGNLRSLGQGTAFLVVLGGTAGALVVQFSPADLAQAGRDLIAAFQLGSPTYGSLIAKLVNLSRRSRAEGLIALESDISATDEPYLRLAVATLVDGHDAPGLRAILDEAAAREQDRLETGPRIFEAAAGYAPTLGILGAVLGLIHAMENLAEPGRLGAGIATAFVSTVYGVGSANLIFLPIAGRMRERSAHELQRFAMIREAICAIREGVNPQALQRRLGSFADGTRTLTLNRKRLVPS